MWWTFLFINYICNFAIRHFVKILLQSCLVVFKATTSQNRLYRVDVTNGDPVVPFGENEVPTAEEADDARITRLEQGGIAPQPVFLFPGAPASCTGDECSPPPIACVGVECFDPGFPNNPVRTLWTQDGVD